MCSAIRIDDDIVEKRYVIPRHWKRQHLIALNICSKNYSILLDVFSTYTAF